MKLPWTTKQIEAPAQRVDRRVVPVWCAACRTQHGPLVYLENGQHYCKRCATKVHGALRIRSAGHRASDVKFP